MFTVAMPFFSDAADLTDLDAGDADRLTLAGRHRLGGLELGVQLKTETWRRTGTGSARG